MLMGKGSLVRKHLCEGMQECDTKNNRHFFSCGGFCNMIYYV